ncbi:unnamed protein product [Linum tenue]|uniref:Uncharacterized protein n=1 Tax=Linum tenue TaxID=586396 RepID=A0AAV0IG56_9ROSI|nr:unnamed protein product [Linum tenue]
MGANNSKAGSAIAINTHDDQPHKQNQQLEVKDVDHHRPNDAVPLSIGFVDPEGMMHVCVPRNTAIPTKKFEVAIITQTDNQQSISFTFYQGQRSKASDNKFLNKLVFYDIPPAPRGGRKFTLSLDVDIDGNLNASVEDKETGQKITSQKSLILLPAEEVEKMVREGEKHALEDKEYVERMRIVRSMVDHSALLREIMAAGDYSKKVRDRVKDIALEMMDEFKEKVKALDS